MTDLDYCTAWNDESMPELSPETQKIVNAAVDVTGYGKETPLLKLRIAAALRAAVDQVVPSEYELVDEYLQYEKQNSIREAFLTIADELEQ